MEENNSAQTVQEPQPQFVPHTFIAQNVPEQNQTTDNKPKTNYLLIILIIVFVNIAVIGTIAFLIMPSKNVKNKIPQTIKSNTNNPPPENSASNNSQTISSLTESTIAPSPKPTTTTSTSDYIPTLIETTHGSIKINLPEEWFRRPITATTAAGLKLLEEAEAGTGSSTRFVKDKYSVILISIKDLRKSLNASDDLFSKNLNSKNVQMQVLKEVEYSFREENYVIASQYSERFGVSALEITERIKRKISDDEFFSIVKSIIFLKNYRIYVVSLSTREDEFDKEWGEFEKNSLNTIEFIN